MGNGAVDSQHGIGVEGCSHPCTEGHHPNFGISAFENPHMLIILQCISFYNTVYIYFLLCSLKINHMKEFRNLHLLLGLLAWLRIAITHKVLQPLSWTDFLNLQEYQHIMVKSIPLFVHLKKMQEDILVPYVFRFFFKAQRTFSNVQG